jgi:phage shock protein A
MTTSTPQTEELGDMNDESSLAGPIIVNESDGVETSPARTDSAGSGDGFVKRLFLAFVKVILALLIIAGLAFGAWLIVRELDRSFDAVIDRVDRNTRRIEEAEATLDTLEEQNFAAGIKIADLEAAVATREQEIANLKEELGAGLEQQGRALADVETETETLTGRADDLDGQAALLAEGLAALQNDLNANSQQIDQVGGTVDGLLADFTALDNRAADLQSQVDDLAAEELAGWRRAVALFRVWDIIGRARLRLLENNLGLAAADIEQAIAAIDDLVGGDSDQLPEDLVAIRERLLLASISLPDQPTATARDLETAWEAVDAMVADAVAGNIVVEGE